ncbi:E3 ubiquitin-protein ligase KEG [Capsicum chinense]|nr:E3 ubiquitin-protein ligase KEG [Capsicum chinense]
MRVPCCSVCQNRYDEEERCPLLLQCGHGFCRECLSRMFSASPDTSLSCPRCRHVSLVGNSVTALKKNYAILALIRDSRYSSEDEDDEEEDGRGFNENGEEEENESRRRGGARTESSSGCGGGRIEVGVHQEVKLIRRIGGESKRPGVEMWAGTVSGGGGGRRCRHKVAVKKVGIGEEMDAVWVQEKLEKLRRESMWCRNVCAFHGVTKMEKSLYLIMDRCKGSVQTEMQQNEGRLTLEQILRFTFRPYTVYHAYGGQCGWKEMVDVLKIGPVPFLKYGADVARGVAELHAAGIVCMNINPSNLLLDANGHAVVSDYGLPAILKKPGCRKARLECESTITHSCMDCTMLSPNYTAPEAWEPVKKSLNLFWDGAIGISPESDAWSFGCTLVEMCTGSIPWAGLSAEEIYRSVIKARKQPPQYASVVGVGIPPELWKMIGECLQFKVSKRPTFSSMLATFLRHLQEIPRSPPASPDNNLQYLETNGVVPSAAYHLEVSLDDPSFLHKLVSEGNVNGVRDLLAKTVSGKNITSLCSVLEAQNADGQTALHLACRRGSVELVEAILEYSQANVDILDKDGDPPLVFALAAGSPECVRALITRHANVRSKLREGLGPSVAHVCAYHGQPDCMRVGLFILLCELLLAGADPNAVDDEGESVLHRAVSKKYTDCAKIILENGGCKSMSILNSKNLTPLHLCVATWNVAVVKRWVELASIEDITNAIDIPSPVGTALCMAAALKKDREAEGRELVRLILAAGADPASQDTQHFRTALHTAAMINDVELVKIILDAGVDVNIKNVNNTIPLHVALNRGAKSCVGLLLSAGANCNIQDDEGDNAFHVAAFSANMIRENLDWIVVMLSGKTLCDYLEALPREWISEDLMEALREKGVRLSPTVYGVGDWVKFKRSIVTPTYGWQGARHKSVGFVQNVLDKDNLIVSFCSVEGREAQVLVDEVVKVIPLDRGQHVKLKPDVKEPRFGWRGHAHDSIGTVLCVDDDGVLRVGFPGASRGWKADPAEMERVEEFKVGDWVRIRPTLTTAKHGFGSATPGSIGVIYCIRPDNSLMVELSYLPHPWHCEPEEVEPVEPFRIADRVCVKRTVAEPRYAWGGETHHSVGKIIDIEADDGDVGIAFCFRSKPFSCSVTDVEKVPPFEVGQEIHVLPSVSQPRLGWSNETPATVGKIVRIDMDGALNVRVVGRDILWKVSPGDAERLSGFEVGDWVRSKPSLGTRPSYDWYSIGKESLAVVHSVQDTGYLELACCFRKGRLMTHYTDIEKVSGFRIGQHVRFRSGLVEPRWGWRGTNPDSRGVITSVNADGEVRVAFFGLQCLWKGDPADLEIEPTFEVAEWVKLREIGSGWKSVGPGSIGIVQGMSYEGDKWDGNVSVAFCGEQDPWVGYCSHLEKVNKLLVGQRVRVRNSVKQPRFGWSGHSHASVGTISAIDADGKLRIYTPAGSKSWMLDPSEVDLVEEKEIQVGDWVKVRENVSNPTHQWGDVSHSSIGVVHRIEDGDLWVAFCFTDRLWLCKAGEMERIRAFKIGDKVKIKDGLVAPRWGWGMETHASRGEVVGVDANGKLRIKFQWREGRPWIGDPADIVLHEHDE